MPDNNHFSYLITSFHNRPSPEEGYLAGYGAVIEYFDLRVPLPDRLAMTSLKHGKHQETATWIVLSPPYKPADSLMSHLTFALKYEGIDLGVLKKLFEKISPEEISALIANEPTGQYSRRIWFLYEWLMDLQLDLPDLATGNYADLIDETLQYGSVPISSRRHRIRNNLPGVREFCPLVRKTAFLEKAKQLDLSGKIKAIIGKIHPDVMARAASFLLLKDSKASYAIEGETPPQSRAQRWGRAISQAGQKYISKDELIRLQQIVIDNPRFTKIGFREQGGFIGEQG